MAIPWRRTHITVRVYDGNPQGCSSGEDATLSCRARTSPLTRPPQPVSRAGRAPQRCARGRAGEGFPSLLGQPLFRFPRLQKKCGAELGATVALDSCNPYYGVLCSRVPAANPWLELAISRLPSRNSGE
ncbi:hypothetical protein Micbo1qcDRAFT_179305 [Microdochium bolleyi]|uniref:Uncharacterized protein n=1 Tax=Microdochium bolleyi TaxID=196109 RepID=A0A136IQ56_9PEZI|nr:hypothetical protein Micbo1qcDRAFT_179305 [Microdochium bolleyi]